MPLLNGHRVELLDVPRLAAQLGALERRTSRGGRDSIDDHGPGGHDDLANAVAGVLVAAAQQHAGAGQILAVNLAAESYQHVTWDAVPP